MSGNQPLDPSKTYRWTITVEGPTGDGRTASQNHWGTYRVRPGETPVDVLESVRIDCARRMGIPINTATAARFQLTD